MRGIQWLLYVAAAIAAVSDDLAAADALFASEGPTANVLTHYDRVVRDLEREPGSHDFTKALVYFKRGLISHSLHKDNSAIADFKRVLALDPHQNQAREKLNELLIARGQWTEVEGHDEAREQWNQAWEAAQASFDAGEWAQTIELLTPVVVTLPGYVKANTLHYQAAKKLYEQDKLAVVGLDAVSRMVSQDLANLIKIAPHEVENYQAFAEHMLFNQVEVQLSKNTVRACLKINNEYKPCGELSKLMAKFGPLFEVLEDYLILMGHYYMIDNQLEVEEPHFPWKSLKKMLFDDPVKLLRREQGNWANNFEYLRAKAEQYAANTQFSLDLTRMACESLVQTNNPLEKVCGLIEGDFLPKDIPKIDALLKKRDFHQAKRMLDKYALLNVGELELFNTRYLVIDDHMRRQQQERQRQQQQYYQHHQRPPPQQRKPPKYDYYKILDVARDADEKTIRKAFRTQTLKYHPDKYKGKEFTPEQIETKMQEINKAYEVLLDKELRERYDMGEDPNDPELQQGGGNPFGGQGGFGGQGHVNFDNIFQQFFQQQARQQQQQQGGPRPKKKKKRAQ